MKQRILVAVVGIPLLLVILLICPDWATMLMIAAICAIAAYEMLHTACRGVSLAVYVITIAAAVIAQFARYFEIKNTLRLSQWAFVMLLFVFAIFRFGSEKKISFKTVCVAAFAGIIMPALYSGVFLVRTFPFGKVYVLAPFVIAFIGDSFSMFGGMIFGGKKMAPHVSPKKTWAGGIAGPIGSAAGMLLLGLVGKAIWQYSPNYVMLALLGFCANIFGQIGDLSMSLIKREMNIKDYSRIFLTHGGMLDRFDSTMFIAPIVFFFVSEKLI